MFLPKFVFIFSYIDTGQKGLRCDAMRCGSRLLSRGVGRAEEVFTCDEDTSRLRLALVLAFSERVLPPPATAIVSPWHN